MMNRSLITVLAAVAISTPAVVAPAIVSPASAQASMNLDLTIGTPPPAPMYEVVPPPRAGYVWAPGYWGWEHERHVWVKGRWMEARQGYRWVPDRWTQVHGGWRHVPGYWDREQAMRDRDHDGVPNRYDRHPDNPYRR